MFKVGMDFLRLYKALCTLHIRLGWWQKQWLSSSLTCCASYVLYIFFTVTGLGNRGGSWNRSSTWLVYLVPASSKLDGGLGTIPFIGISKANYVCWKFVFDMWLVYWLRWWLMHVMTYIASEPWPRRKGSIRFMYTHCTNAYILIELLPKKTIIPSSHITPFALRNKPENVSHLYRWRQHEMDEGWLGLILFLPFNLWRVYTL